jgi:hypothetical protein
LAYLTNSDARCFFIADVFDNNEYDIA